MALLKAGDMNAVNLKLKELTDQCEAIHKRNMEERNVMTVDDVNKHFDERLRLFRYDPFGKILGRPHSKI